MTYHHLTTGDPAPDFTLRNQQNKEVTPMALEGNRILLSFHPLAWTSICEIQMRTLEAKKSVFEDMDVIAYGLSVDSAQSKKAWADAIDVKGTNLLADFWPHGKVASDYGLFMEDMGASNRANVLIGLDRRIEWIKVYETLQVPDIEEIINFISSQQQ